MNSMEYPPTLDDLKEKSEKCTCGHLTWQHEGTNGQLGCNMCKACDGYRVNLLVRKEYLEKIIRINEEKRCEYLRTPWSCMYCGLNFKISQTTEMRAHLRKEHQDSFFETIFMEQRESWPPNANYQHVSTAGTYASQELRAINEKIERDAMENVN